MGCDLHKAPNPKSRWGGRERERERQRQRQRERERMNGTSSRTAGSTHCCVGPKAKGRMKGPRKALCTNAGAHAEELEQDAWGTVPFSYYVRV